MSLQVVANYCLVMVIDKAINAAEECSRWSEEIPTWPLVEPPPLIICPSSPRVKGEKKVERKLVLPSRRAGGASAGGGVAETQVQVNQCYQADRLI